MPWLVLDRDLDLDLALEMAKDIGLRDSVITDRALQYIRTRQAMSANED